MLANLALGFTRLGGRGTESGRYRVCARSVPPVRGRGGGAEASCDEQLDGMDDS